MRCWRTSASRHVMATMFLLFFAWIAANGVRAESQPRVAGGFSAEKLARVSAYMHNEVSAGKIAGAVLLIQQHGRPVLSENFGMRDVEQRQAMTSDTIFRLYSMSKAITSVAAMMLVDDGKLSLDDPLTKFIPAFFGTKVERDQTGMPTVALEPLAHAITIRDLLRHTSGLTYGFY